MNAKEVAKIAQALRRDVAIMTTFAGSGHLTSSLSCSEIVSTLFFNEMNYDNSNPFNENNDEFILSKGHATPVLYAVLKKAGCITDDLNSLRKFNSNLEGHAMPPAFKWVKVGSGSLGQGLSVGVGMALASTLSKKKYRTYVLVGDSEMAEGANYEAMELASYYKLNNLCVIVDVNKLGQRGETMLAYNLKGYKNRFDAFGWNSIIVDGHNVKHLIQAFGKAKNSKKPTAIIAKTVKGKGISFLEERHGWHGKTLNSEELQRALKELPEIELPEIKVNKPKECIEIIRKIKIPYSTEYNCSENVATRDAYGRAIAKLAEINTNFIALDGEVSNSTFANEVKKVRPKQFIESFIAEQNMVGMAQGLAVKGYDVFASSFGAFLSRAHDQIRMAALSSANLTICGSHAGVSTGEDGASQMGLEDISMFRALPNSIVFYPSDAVSTEKLVYLSAELKGIKYIRTTRPKTPVIYKNTEEFLLGEFKILKQSLSDRAVLVGAGITLYESLKAHEWLKNEGISTAVIDLYCIKPFNSKRFIDFVKQHGNRLIVTEDHRPEGGIGEMLSSELNGSGIKVISLSIKEIPHSGKGEELLDKYGISARAIADATAKMIRESKREISPEAY